MGTHGFVLAKISQGKNAFVDGLIWAVVDKKHWDCEDGWYICKVLRLTNKNLQVLEPLSSSLGTSDVKILLGINLKSFGDFKTIFDVSNKNLLDDDLSKDDRFVALKDIALNTGVDVYKVTDLGTQKFLKKLERLVTNQIFKKYIEG